MLCAYLDESGGADTAVLAVAGYVSTAAQWRMFARDWSTVLNSHGIKTFHASECEAFRGEFTGWTEVQRDMFKRSLASVIRERTIYWVSHAVPVQVYSSVANDTVGRAKMGSPYGFCCQQCITGISEWAKRHWRKDEVDLFFDQGNKFYNDTSELYRQASQDERGRRKWRILDIHFGDRRSLLPLQAADYLAYEIFKHHSNEAEGQFRPERKSFTALLHGKYEGRFYDAKSLQKWKALLAASVPSRHSSTGPNRRGIT